MSETWFADNYSDLSVQSGVNAGFQFQFSCERCGDAYRTQFASYRKGQAAGWLDKATGFFSGILGQADAAAGSLAEAGWKSAWDESFRQAVTEAKGHFNRCARCFQYVCAKCFNASGGLCFNCAPDAEIEIEAGKATGKAQGASEVGQAAGHGEGIKMDASRDRQLVCPQCGVEAHGAKFCPECGAQLATTVKCGGCGAESPPGTKFCPECGQKMT